MKKTSWGILITLFVTTAQAHTNYTGYSGAPQTNGTCSVSCHHRRSFAPTITVTGFPASYIPGQQYTVNVARQSGSNINQFNASIRVGTGATNAGVIASGTNTVIYNSSHETNGVHWSSSNQSSGNFLWTAPAVGTGTVRLYLAGLQGSLSNGSDTAIVQISTENTTGIDDSELPEAVSLEQNYPNPFNAETIIRFNVAQPGLAELSIDNILGQTVYEWSEYIDHAGPVSIRWDSKGNNGDNLPSGIYFYQLRTNEGVQTKKMVLLR